MNLEGIMLSDGGSQILYDFTYMWNIKNKQTKNKINEQTKQKQTCRFKEQSSGYQRGRDGVGGGGARMWKMGSTVR